MIRRTNFVPVIDVIFENGDIVLEAGDVKLTNSYEDHVVGAIVSYLETDHGDQPYISPHWGFPGRDVDYSTAGDDAFYDVEMYLSHLLDPRRGPLSHLIADVLNLSPEPPSGDNAFAFRVRAKLRDFNSTVMNRRFEFDGATGTVAVT